jgi:hypothetical protein
MAVFSINISSYGIYVNNSGAMIALIHITRSSWQIRMDIIIVLAINTYFHINFKGKKARIKRANQLGG